MGIGAYETREFVRSLGGDVDVVSRPAWEHFPAASAIIRSTHTGDHEQDRQRLRIRNGDRIRKLLVVEDDPGLQNQLRWAFDGYEVMTVGDRRSALEQIRTYQPPVVTLDLGLPPTRTVPARASPPCRRSCERRPTPSDCCDRQCRSRKTPCVP